METLNNFRSEIGFAVWMAVEGWRKFGGGRGSYRRLAARLANEPTTYPMEVLLMPCPAEPGPGYAVCECCGWEINRRCGCFRMQRDALQK